MLYAFPLISIGMLILLNYESKQASLFLESMPQIVLDLVLNFLNLPKLLEDLRLYANKSPFVVKPVINLELASSYLADLNSSGKSID